MYMEEDHCVLFTYSSSAMRARACDRLPSFCQQLCSGFQVCVCVCEEIIVLASNLSQPFQQVETVHLEPVNALQFTDLHLQSLRGEAKLEHDLWGLLHQLGEHEELAVCVCVCVCVCVYV